MAGTYTDNPLNFDVIAPLVITDSKQISEQMIRKNKCFFYDACSFRRHANLKKEEAVYLLRYVRMQDGIFVITRCILMELASHSGLLNREYVQYIENASRFGIGVLLIYEDDLFDVMAQCFGTNRKINECLIWAVRGLKSPVSTVTATLEQNSSLSETVIRGKNLEKAGIYESFFKTVRKNKEPGDNLGEELIAICLYLLSYLPGEEDGKFCVITDDKGAAGKLGIMFRRIAKNESAEENPAGLFSEGWERHCKNRVAMFSTPRLVQIMVREGILTDREHIKAILQMGTEGNIVVLGMRLYDLRNRTLSMNCEELTDLIMNPNGIHIVF